ncbi:TetR family transcriptional regulator [Mycetocola lacteus]|uniref:TetR family transcriptional regulator n=1 Tax=Mycetocola lacteus TaxID=76637 RepID=UPI001601E990|nr:TetR family transcriptional regulator [Mycetocola lacteus]
MDQILEFLVDVPLAQASFRALADALGVSTFALVYHFGNREQLDQEILGVVRDRQVLMLGGIKPGAINSEELVEAGVRAWEESLSRRGLLAGRLSFEAGVTERLRYPAGDGILAAAHSDWVRALYEWALAHGASEEDAESEAELLVAVLSGLRYRLHLYGADAVPITLVETAFRRFTELVTHPEPAIAR